MKKKEPNYAPKYRLRINESKEGEPIEFKIERKVNNGEPMNEPGVQLLYTERAKGVLPETDIRTDRFEVAIEATDKIAKSFAARRGERAGEKKSDGEPESIQGKDSNGQ